MSQFPSGPIPHEAWTADRIEPTFQDGDEYWWVIDGRYEIARTDPLPIRAWAPIGERFLATFWLGSGASSMGFEVWQIATQGRDGRVEGTIAGGDRDAQRNIVRRLAPIDRWPQDPDSPVRYLPQGKTLDPPPLLQRIVAAGVVQRRRAAAFDHLRRAADPYVELMESLNERAMDAAAEMLTEDEPPTRIADAELRNWIAERTKEQLGELLRRVTIEHSTAALEEESD